MTDDRELKLYQDDEYATGDYLRSAVDYGGKIEVEVYEPWAGDTETGFGRGGSVRLTKEQALQLANWLVRAAASLVKE